MYGSCNDSFPYENSPFADTEENVRFGPIDYVNMTKTLSFVKVVLRSSLYHHEHVFANRNKIEVVAKWCW